MGLELLLIGCAAKVEARTTSRVVIPNRWVGSKTPALFKASAAIGSVEFTGLVTTQHVAEGHVAATSVKISRIMLALVWIRISNYASA